MKNKIVVVLGNKGRGKTTLVKRFILPQFAKYIVVDTLGEYKDFGVVITEPESLATYLASNLKKNYHIVFQDKGETIKRGTFANAVNVFSLAWSAIGACIVVEELDTYCSAIKPDFDIERIIRYGRHRFVSIVGVSRRPAEIPKTITSQADLVVCFKIQEPRDIAYMSTFTSPLFAEFLKELGDLHFAVYVHNEHVAEEMGIYRLEKKEDNVYVGTVEKKGGETDVGFQRTDVERISTGSSRADEQSGNVGEDQQRDRGAVEKTS